MRINSLLGSEAPVLGAIGAESRAGEQSRGCGEMGRLLRRGWQEVGLRWGQEWSWEVGW